MSTETGTEKDVETAEWLDALMPKAIRAQRMTALWKNYYDELRAVMLASLRELGRDDGTPWTAAGVGSVRVTVRAGNTDWQKAYESLSEALVNLLDEPISTTYELERGIEAALAASTPQRRPASDPFVELTPAKALPPAIEQARREGAMAVIHSLRSTALADDRRNALGAVLVEIADTLADEYGGDEGGQAL